MRTTKSALIVVTSMLIFSVLVANVANILNQDDAYLPPERGEIKERRTPATAVAGDSVEHLIWFLQISDLHVSIFRDPSRITEFKEFCDQTLDVIEPSVVLASGDLTDAKTRDNIGSKQFKGEWVQYRKVLDEAKVTEKTIWLDIRGNHDNFNVVGLESKENFFPNYSIQGRAHPRSYLRQLRKNGDLYSFIGVDACLEPGPRRPFNFVGMLDRPEIDELNRLVRRVEATGSDYTVWFGHFPTSCILTSDGENVRTLFRKLDQSLVYVCGHLHTLGGLVNKMYTLQKDGFLELELGDWKDNRRYRLMAIDHGLLSFIDVRHREWPVVLVTNPKHALFMIPNKEDPGVMINSTHISSQVAGIFAVPVTTVKVKIDEGEFEMCEHVKGPLYVLEWKPGSYLSGLHYIEVFVQDEHGRETLTKQPFSLDGTRLSFDILPRLALMTNASTIFKLMFVTLLVCSVSPLILFRVLHSLVKKNVISGPNLPRNCFRRWLRQLWILSTVDRIFWPLVLYPVYLCFGPWSIGHIIEDHVGVIFAWGIFINGTFLPGSFTYAYGFLQLLTFQIPITIILANGVHHRFQYHVVKPGKSKTLCGHVKLNLPFVVLFTVQLVMAYFFWLAYGTMAFLLGPLRTWSVILALILWQQALHLPEKCTREAAAVWYPKSKIGRSPSEISLDAAVENEPTVTA